MFVFGLDISLDHGGVVVLDKAREGEIRDWYALTDVKKYYDICPDHVLLLSKQNKDELKDTFRLRRMKEYLDIIDTIICRSWNIPVYFSIEGYSYASQSTSICQIAELTGYLKQAIFEQGGYIRIHDPLSVKLFATNNGSSMKKEIVEKALKWINVPEGLIKRKQVVKRNNGKVEEFDGPATDIADAYFLAKMLYFELMVREGKLILEHLSEGERRVFLRTTKMYPVNLLSRPFICQEGEEK